MNRLHRRSPPGLPFALLLGLSLATGTALAADAPATPKKDAAEAVQEGNVRQWIEYYERSRQPSPPRPPEKPAGKPDKSPPAETPAR